MAEHDRLGVACGSAGVHQGRAEPGSLVVLASLEFGDCCVIFFEIHEILVGHDSVGVHEASGAEIVVLVEHDHLAEFGELRPHFQDLVQLLLIFDAEQNSVRVVEHVSAGLSLVRDVDTAGDTVGHNGAMEGEGPFRAVIWQM